MRKIEEFEEWLKLTVKKPKRVKKVKAMTQAEAERIVAQATHGSVHTVKSWWRKNKVNASLTLAEAVLRSLWTGRAVRINRLTIRAWAQKDDTKIDLE